jgi:hypothetical protein
MSRIRIALVGVVAAGLMPMSAGAASASESVETSVVNEVLNLEGGWYIASPTKTTVTTSESDPVVSTSESKDYKAQIQQPINPDSTSTWPAKRGVIPVQFKLSEQTKTTSVTKVTKTVKTEKAPSFQSRCQTEDDPVDNYSYVSFYPASSMTIAGITSLKADYEWLVGSNHGGGSLRWMIHTTAGSIEVPYGEIPNYLTDPGQSGVNLITLGDNRFNTTALGGPYYNSWTNVLNGWGDLEVHHFDLIVDGCWTGADQVLDLQSASVNQASKLIPELVLVSNHSATEESDPVTTSAWVQTNQVPAKIVVEKRASDPTVYDGIEQLSSAQGDSTGQFRQIDGKYMYNLKAETLGVGNFNVYIAPDGYTNAQGNAKVLVSPGVFELK